MSTVEQLQVVVSEVQAARQQVSNVRAQGSELEGTIQAVKDHPAHLSLHRQMGGVLIEVHDRQTLLQELETTLMTLNGHLERFVEREKQLISSYEELKASLTEA